jgi:ABC-2 type transport system ATP-binding protein
MTWTDSTCARSVPRLTASDLTVRRGPNRVVDGLSLSIGAGSIFWIVGPNGAGKTSLLRVLAGLDRPRSGTVAREPRVGAPFLYFHSEMALPPWSTVAAWDRLVAGLAPGAEPPTELRPDLRANRWVRRLSTGERKRLLLDALLRLPGSLLLDEPYEHLSPAAKGALSRLVRRRARTDVVVVVTNQASYRRDEEAGVRVEAGTAEALGTIDHPGTFGVQGPGDTAP